MRRITSIIVIVLALTFCACGGKRGGGNASGHSGGFACTFTDEFGNRFELFDNHRGTIQFDKNDNVDSITWFDGENHDRPFATINYNGNPNYYYLRDGSLYRHEDDMVHGRCAIKIVYE